MCVTVALMRQLLPMWVSGVERCFLAFVSRQTVFFLLLFLFTAKSETIVSHSSQAPVTG